ncbi:MAG: hypothetical protein H0U75_11950 [Legionella sp.]|nr:hypothetical protein [Legionella sp.]
MKLFHMVLITVLSVPAQAGVNAVTAHSRANCGNNESVTWFLSGAYWWRVISYHYTSRHPAGPNSPHHTMDTGKGYTWRQAAIHWGESGLGGNYYVLGMHYYYPNGRETLDVKTDAVDCAIYDGWNDY